MEPTRGLRKQRERSAAQEREKSARKRREEELRRNPPPPPACSVCGRIAYKSALWIGPCEKCSCLICDDHGRRFKKYMGTEKESGELGYPTCVEKYRTVYLCEHHDSRWNRFFIGV